MADPVPPLLPPSAGYLPIWKDQRKIDADHLRLLAIFHGVLAAAGLLFLGLLLLHYQLMNQVFSDPKFWQNGRGVPPPEMFAIFKWVYVFAGGIIVAGMVLNALSGWCIARRQARVFSLFVAGLDCLQLPFGTILGVFTLVVLLRDSVREAYEVQP